MHGNFSSFPQTEPYSRDSGSLIDLKIKPRKTRSRSDPVIRASGIDRGAVTRQDDLQDEAARHAAAGNPDAVDVGRALIGSPAAGSLKSRIIGVGAAAFGTGVKMALAEGPKAILGLQMI